MEGQALPLDGTAFRPNHRTYVVYPAPNVHELQGGEMRLLPPHALKSRYEPTSAVPGEPGPIDERRTCSVRNAPAILMSELEAHLRGSDHDLDYLRLVEDMRNVEQYHGSTLLEGLTYARNTAPADVVQVCIRRVTFLHLAGSRIRLQETYNLTIADLHVLEQMEDGDSFGLWFRNLTDLIFRRSDLAVRYVADTLDELGLTEVGLNWLRPRHPNYRQLLKPKVVTFKASGSEEDDMCTVCYDDMASQEVVQLPCAGRVKHRFHLSCVVTICETEGAEGCRCPYCREKLITSAADLAFLEDGCIGKDYIPDPKYNDYENFEKSCADLDRAMATGVTEETIDCTDQIRTIFEILVNGEEMVPNSTTPQHLQYVRSPDFVLFEQAVIATIQELKGMDIRPRMFYQLLKTTFSSVAISAYKAGGLVQLLDQDDLDIWAENQPHLALDAVRPGFHAWAFRLVGRMCAFMHVRRCWCPRSLVGGSRRISFHSHGGRVYYSPSERDV